MKPIKVDNSVCGGYGYLNYSTGLSKHLGAVYPFYDAFDTNSISLNIGEILSNKRMKGSNINLDMVGLAAKSINSYLLGNRTLIDGVCRAPWLAKQDDEKDWMQEKLPKHGSYKPSDPELFSSSLKQALVEEVQCYIRDAKTVGILLSGGMDSRVVAGIVRYIQQELGYGFKVVGLTWGNENSRDVVYSKLITDRFGWERRHFPLNPEVLLRNIRHMGRMGAEVSPLHLHAMPDVALTSNVDVILAGSYGDMVGRAEFSGRHLTQLQPLLTKQKDRFGILREQLLKDVEKGLKSDLKDSPNLSENISRVRRLEIEQHCHYTRRMLQCCMTTISEYKPFYQVFTSPNVFGLMWNLAPSVRDNRWYSYLLSDLPGNLLEVPWARTGKRYDDPQGQGDELSKSYHEYGRWLRNDLRSEIIERVNSNTIRSLGIFNDRGLDLALSAWKRSKTNSVNSLDELFSWIASLYDFIEIYEIKTDEPMVKASWLDELNALRGGAFARSYVEIRNRLRE